MYKEGLSVCGNLTKGHLEGSPRRATAHTLTHTRAHAGLTPLDRSQHTGKEQAATSWPKEPLKLWEPVVKKIYSVYPFYFKDLSLGDTL